VNKVNNLFYEDDKYVHSGFSKKFIESLTEIFVEDG